MYFDDDYLKKIEERVYDEAVRAASKGVKIVGVYCAFTPKELIAAAGAIPVALCSGSQAPMAAAEAHLPRALCPIVKSSYGHALDDSCPYFHMVDLILADATCDGKKKMYELLARLRPLHMLQLPQTADTEEANSYWISEVYRIKGILEDFTGARMGDDAVGIQIRLYNRLRKAILGLFELNREEQIPLMFGRELKAVTSMAGFELNLEQRIREMESAGRLARERGKSPEFRKSMSGRPRVLMTGCPVTNRKVLDLIEELGAVVVALENCGGLKTAGNLVPENGDPVASLARRYLKTACSCMSPNLGRLEILGNLIRDYRVDGVVDLTWDACHTYNVEAFAVREAVVDRFDRPYIQVWTDYSENDEGQLRTRIEAFLEILK